MNCLKDKTSVIKSMYYLYEDLSESNLQMLSMALSSFLTTFLQKVPFLSL